MAFWISLLLIGCMSQTMCDLNYYCPGTSICCEGEDDWLCCDQPAGICCPGNTYCCPSLYSCQPTTASCVFDPYNFLYIKDQASAVSRLSNAVRV